MLLLVGCGAGNELESLDGALSLLEFETRELSFRYTDARGLPVAGAHIRFSTEGPANGAVLRSRAGVTDVDGISRVVLETELAAAFKVVADADGAQAPASTAVSVAADNGGRLDIDLRQGSVAAVTQVQIMLLDHYDCSGFDPFHPPAPTSSAVRTQQTVTLQGGRASVTMAGLAPDTVYALVAVGRNGGQVVAGACSGGLSITQDEIDRNRAVTVAVDLGDFVPGVAAAALEVTTDFDAPLTLTGIAGLFERLAAGPNDPADYLLSLMAARSDSLEHRAIAAYRAQLAQILGNTTSAEQDRTDLRGVALALRRATGIRLHTVLELQPNDVDTGGAAGVFDASHRFSYFEAEVEGHVQKYFVAPGQRFFEGAPAPLLQSDTQVTIPDASRVSIDAHQLGIPVSDAIVLRLLVDTFGDDQIDQILARMVACDRVGSELSQIAEGAYAAISAVIVTDICIDTVKDVVQDVERELRQDLQRSYLDQRVTLEGTADIRMRPDGKTIDRLVNGQWIGIGTFGAERL